MATSYTTLIGDTKAYYTLGYIPLFKLGIISGYFLGCKSQEEALKIISDLGDPSEDPYCTWGFSEGKPWYFTTSGTVMVFREEGVDVFLPLSRVGGYHWGVLECLDRLGYIPKDIDREALLQEEEEASDPEDSFLHCFQKTKIKVNGNKDKKGCKKGGKKALIQNRNQARRMKYSFGEV